VGFRIVDAVLGALAPVFPTRVPAAGDGGPNGIAIGIVEADGDSTVLWDPLAGAWGARPDRDGVDGISALGSNLTNTPIEELERSGHLRIDGYGYLPDSGGAGRWRGGLATFRDMTLLAPEATVQIRSDRRMFLPYGLAGGAPGTPSLNILDPDGNDERMLSSKPHFVMTAGDRHRHVTAGGGGHGPAFERTPERVLEDVIDGKVTHAGAAKDYGVVVTADDVIDASATARLRGQAR
jgi:N-methylhydantoinase B